MQDKSLQPTAGAALLFLREDELRAAQDILFFAYRDLTASADELLAELGFGRAHHRTLHFIGRNAGLPVGELLFILGITKQSLARVLGPLIRQGYVSQTQGRTDRRQRLLTLTAQGAALERKLFERQRDRLIPAFREAGGPAVEGFRKVLRLMMKDEARVYMDRAEMTRNAKPVRAPG
ncbi:MAG: MarR family transcriptional regulator [Rhodospirillales bacterium 20-60-12]|nr:MAG: MarR family transcriptional regulator [Rhodospirillales bacterium 20-60-12]HQT68403.1 MarR family transcriptional regulator [Acetobacteraceae bacterium]